MGATRRKQISNKISRYVKWLTVFAVTALGGFFLYAVDSVGIIVMNTILITLAVIANFVEHNKRLKEKLVSQVWQHSK